MQGKTKFRVLHVEGHVGWQKRVRDILPENYHVTSFEKLADARQAATNEDFDYFICGTQVGSDGGGVWAQELHSSGKKVMILALSGRSGIPMLSKANFDARALLRMIETL